MSKKKTAKPNLSSPLCNFVEPLCSLVSQLFIYRKPQPLHACLSMWLWNSMFLCVKKICKAKNFAPSAPLRETTFIKNWSLITYVWLQHTTTATTTATSSVFFCAFVSSWHRTSRSPHFCYCNYNCNFFSISSVFFCAFVFLWPNFYFSNSFFS
jgi:hypothetical protein